MTISAGEGRKMAAARPVSMLLALCLALGAFVATGFWTAARAHEVLPAIADLEVVDDRAVMAISLNLEGLVAGIDLDAVENTNEAAQASDYDSLRALEPDVFAERFREFWPEMQRNLVIEADGVALTPDLIDVTVAPVGDPSIPRQSQVILAADLPAGAQSLTVGWARDYGDLVLRQIGVEEGYTGMLEGGAVSDPIAVAGGGALGGWQSFFAYVAVGFDHIIPLGLDHILFVLGLFFLSPRVRPLLWQVSAFTLAHTVTLALGALDIVRVPGSIVEPLIALSITYVAVENLFHGTLNRWRPLVIFGFGLLHGLGFASVLDEFGLPQDQFVPALLGFNIGVEFGQLTVIAVALAVSWAALRASRMAGMETGVVAGYIAVAVALAGLGYAGSALIPVDAQAVVLPFLVPLSILCFLCAIAVAASSVGLHAYRQFVAIPASLTIALIGSYWAVERVFL